MADAERAVFPRGAGRASGGLELRCVVFAHRGDSLVLVRHRRHPVFGDAWTLPGGILEYGVSPRESSARILIDQAGTPPESMRLLGLESSMEGDWILTFPFDAEVRADPVAGRGIAEARLIDEPPELHPLARRLWEAYRIHERAKSV